MSTIIGEDELKTRNGLKQGLVEAGFEVDLVRESQHTSSVGGQLTRLARNCPFTGTRRGSYRQLSCLSLYQPRRSTMKTNFKSFPSIASILLASAVLAGCSAMSSSPAPELQQRIEAARTRADHASLADYYTKHAATARAAAAEHRKTAKAYGSGPISAKGGLSMAAHCNSIVRQFEGIATDYENMAAEHRKLGDSAPQ